MASYRINVLTAPGTAPNSVTVRRIVYQDSKGSQWVSITNRYDLEPLLIVELYLYRQQIELFFGWMGRHLQFGHWYSENENGVLIQLYAGLICFLLLKCFAALADRPEWLALRIDVVRWVCRHLFDTIDLAQLDFYALKLRALPNLVKT